MTGCLPPSRQKAAGIASRPMCAARRTKPRSPAIRRLAARQYDKPAWCRTIAQVIDGGAYDIDRRSDLEAPLKRIFGRD